MNCILDCHDSDTSQDSHDGEELPEAQGSQQGKTSNVYSVRSIKINMVPYEWVIIAGL